MTGFFCVNAAAVVFGNRADDRRGQRRIGQHQRECRTRCANVAGEIDKRCDQGMDAIVSQRVQVSFGNGNVDTGTVFPGDYGMGADG